MRRRWSCDGDLQHTIPVNVCPATQHSTLQPPGKSCHTNIGFRTDRLCARGCGARAEEDREC